MNLGDQLKELRDVILRDRSDLIAGDTDSLWSDETLLRYMKDADRQFARRTLMIRDGHSPEYCKVTLRADVREYALHELVIAVISGRTAGQQTDLYRSGHSLVQVPKRREVLDFDTISNDTATTGMPQAIYTDETLVYASRSRVTLSVYPVPTATEAGTVINLRVVRLPKGAYTLGDLDQESEVPEDYQLDTLQWAAYRALSNHDGDAGSSTSAEKHELAFEKALARAIKEMKRKVFVGTGFNYGTNGFTWER